MALASGRTTTQNVFGYTDRLAARPGEQLSFHISCEGPPAYDAALVRLRHGYDGQAGPGFLETEVPSAIDGTYPGQYYACQPGSYVEVPDPKGLLATPDALVIRASVFPTLPRDNRSGSLGAYRVSQSSVGFTGERQAVMGTWDAATMTGWALLLDEGKPSFVWSEGGQRRTLTLEQELTAHQWYRLEVELPRSEGQITLRQAPLDHCADRVAPAAAAAVPEQASAPPRRSGRLPRCRSVSARWLAGTVTGCSRQPRSTGRSVASASNAPPTTPPGRASRLLPGISAAASAPTGCCCGMWSTRGRTCCTAAA